jgi:pimeloyl-ACP methyl ester carboxylesterase
VINDAAIDVVVGQGVALAWFDRVGLAWDGPDALRGGPVHNHWPQEPWSAIAVWAWGICRSVTALEMVLNAPQIAVIGHSRGGKAALVAATYDPRIQALVSHNSGTGGVSRLWPIHPGAESLADLAERFPHWLSPQVQDPRYQAHILQADLPEQWLTSLAPRGVCILQAEDDLWANPKGSWAMFEHLKPAWQAAPERLRWHSRSGGHGMTALDWQRAAEFSMHVLCSHADQPKFSERA